MITVVKCALFTLAMIACVWQGGYSPILSIILTGIGCTIIALTKEVDEVKPVRFWSKHIPPMPAARRPKPAPVERTCGGTDQCLLCLTVCRDRLAELELAERFNRESG